MTKTASFEATQIGFRVTICQGEGGPVIESHHFKVNVATFNRRPKVAADEAFANAKAFAAAHGCN